MRFHVLGLRHTLVRNDYNWCPFTIQTRNFVRMMAARGHAITLYANKNSQAFEDVEGVDLFDHPMGMSWNIEDWRAFNELTIKELSSRLRDDDLILTMAGCCQKQVADAFPRTPTIEYGIGYDGAAVFAQYRVYVSNAHREWCLGRIGRRDEDVDSTAIPCSFDLSEFRVDRDIADVVREKVGSKPYLFFMGRPTKDKGFDVADEISQMTGIRIIVAGEGFRYADDATDDDRRDVHFFGRASIPERAVLMHDAVAVLAPTRYREPFGCVAVEAQLCRTPAITTDVGGFTETVDREWRCASIDEFCAAVSRALSITADQRRSLAFVAGRRFGFDAIAPQYEKFFARVRAAIS